MAVQKTRPVPGGLRRPHAGSVVAQQCCGKTTERASKKDAGLRDARRTIPASYCIHRLNPPSDADAIEAVQRCAIQWCDENSA
ncbi:hypothetical protein F6X42_41315 [Paraburkholderia sp. WC7.3b]|uniref:Uncharacterized protein n=1 Tax=Paraburkholderia podalyriae TaxID=1938811 RepID=A0ABR7Q217_9BURK|nr:hypothetical protein [Paraburkholderia podalyriae]